VAVEGIPDHPRNGATVEVIIFRQGGFLRSENSVSISSLGISSFQIAPHFQKVGG
jgi:hypothetical protein